MDISKQIIHLQRYMNKLIRFIFSLLSPRTKNPLAFYVKNGNVIIGANTIMDRLNIYIQTPIPNVPYVIIGDDCMLSGQILIHGNNARVKVGNRVFMGDDSKIFCRESISLDDDIMISWGCTLIDTNAHSLHSAERKNDVTDWKKGPEFKNWDVVKSIPIHIKSQCWIGFNAIITKGVTLSEGTVLGSGSVLTKSTEPFGVYAGNPAKFIKQTD